MWRRRDGPVILAVKSQVTPSVTGVVMIDLRTLGTLDLRVRDGPELLSVLS